MRFSAIIFMLLASDVLAGHSREKVLGSLPLAVQISSLGGLNSPDDSINSNKRQNLCYAVGLGGTALVHAGLY